MGFGLYPNPITITSLHPSIYTKRLRIDMVEMKIKASFRAICVLCASFF